MRTTTFIEAVQAVLEYLSDDLELYKQSRAEGIDTGNHIGKYLMTLQVYFEDIMSLFMDEKSNQEEGR